MIGRYFFRPTARSFNKRGFVWYYFVSYLQVWLFVVAQFYTIFPSRLFLEEIRRRQHQNNNGNGHSALYPWYNFQHRVTRHSFSTCDAHRLSRKGMRQTLRLHSHFLQIFYYRSVIVECRIMMNTFKGFLHLIIYSGSRSQAKAFSSISITNGIFSRTQICYHWQ